jgi:putative membrane protein
MKRPTAILIETTSSSSAEPRSPRAFALTEAAPATEFVESHSDDIPDANPVVPLKRMGWLSRLVWGSAGLLASLAIGLGLNALVANLFATNSWLGWVGLGLVAIFIIALIVLLARELGSLSRLRTLDHLRSRATLAIASDRIGDARPILGELKSIYAPRPDLARALEDLRRGEPQIFDGVELLKFTERTLMASLDRRARALTAASARRVALVTAISPRALVDIAYVIWESIRLGSAIARLYGARPGLWGTWRLIGAILSHLAVTGGLVLTDGVVEQLVGQGLAARLSQRLGEGVVNGLMTVRVGIAAMRVVRPLPFTTEPAPMVRDYLPELMKVVKGKDAP